jgi:hypothetical protein
MTRARDADGTGDQSACEQALAEAQRVLLLKQQSTDWSTRSALGVPFSVAGVAAAEARGADSVQGGRVRAVGPVH